MLKPVIQLQWRVPYSGYELKIEILPGNGICKECNKVFNLIENNNTCPKCGSKHWEVLCGKEFMIKEIVAC